MCVCVNGTVSYICYEKFLCQQIFKYVKIASYLTYCKVILTVFFGCWT